MEINISEFMMNCNDTGFYSNSIINLGDNAAQITWNNAVNSGFELLKTNEEKQTFISYMESMGFEFDKTFNDKELNGLFVQLISGDINEGNEDNIIYPHDSIDNEYYYYLGD